MTNLGSFDSLSTMAVVAAVVVAGLSGTTTVIGFVIKGFNRQAKPAVIIQIDGKTVDVGSLNTEDRREFEAHREN